MFKLLRTSTQEIEPASFGTYELAQKVALLLALEDKDFFIIVT